MVDNNWKHNWSPLSDECETCGKSGLRVRQEMRSMGQSECRHEPAEQKAWEPALGEMCQCTETGYRGKFHGSAEGIGFPGLLLLLDPLGCLRPDGTRSWCVPSGHLRPIQEDSPPARASADVGPPPAVDWTKTCCQCGCARDDHSPTCSYFKKPAEPVRADPYAQHRRELNEEFNGDCYTTGSPMDRLIFERMTLKNEARLSAMSRADRLKSEALRMMDRECGAKAYRHWPESWSTPGWES